eukprot:365509-Chlamydomonas_euryale.AAC.9
MRQADAKAGRRLCSRELTPPSMGMYQSTTSKQTCSEPVQSHNPYKALQSKEQATTEEAARRQGKVSDSLRSVFAISGSTLSTTPRSAPSASATPIAVRRSSIAGGLAASRRGLPALNPPLYMRTTCKQDVGPRLNEADRRRVDSWRGAGPGQRTRMTSN